MRLHLHEECLECMIDRSNEWFKGLAFGVLLSIATWWVFLR